MAAQANDRHDNAKYSHLVGDDQTDQSVPGTHRASDSFPAGSECELTVDDLPDDETVFGWTHHYEHESRSRSDPDVTNEIINELLTSGICRKATGSSYDNRYLLQKTIDGYEWTMVVADDADTDYDERWVLITIYSNYHGSVGITNRYLDRYRQRRSEK